MFPRSVSRRVDAALLKISVGTDVDSSTHAARSVRVSLGMPR